MEKFYIFVKGLFQKDRLIWRKSLYLGQNIVDKLMKLSKLSFSMEFFTVDFLQFSSVIVTICLMGDHPGTRHRL